MTKPGGLSNIFWLPLVGLIHSAVPQMCPLQPIFKVPQQNFLCFELHCFPDTRKTVQHQMNRCSASAAITSVVLLDTRLYWKIAVTQKGHFPWQFLVNMKYNDHSNHDFLLFLSSAVEAESSESLARTWMWSRSQKWGSPSVLLILSPRGGEGAWTGGVRESWTEGRIIGVHWRDGGGSSQRQTVPRVHSVKSNRYVYVIILKEKWTHLLTSECEFFMLF